MGKQNRPKSTLFVLTVLLTSLSSPLAAQLPDPDGRPADMSKPVQVYILMGQSNMLEMGKVRGGEGSLEHAVKEKGLYPNLIDEDGNWTERKDVRYVRVMGSGGPGKTRQLNNEWMTVKGQKIGVEIGIGHQIGEAVDAPVMILKSAIGNRALGWDLLGAPGLQGLPGEVEERRRPKANRLVCRSPVRRRCRPRESGFGRTWQTLPRRSGVRSCRLLLVAG